MRSDRATRVLVSSPDTALAEGIKRLLSPFLFDVAACHPGPGFMEAARRQQPQVAVIDRVHERPDTAQLEIVILKELRPDVRIIAVSEEPSAGDGRVVELGVFYYTSTSAGAELARVIAAAARPTHKRAEHR